MTNERAAKIVLDLINAGEAEYRYFSVEEIIAFKKAYVALNPEPVTNADRIRSMTDKELADELLEWYAVFSAVEWTKDMILDWLKQECTDDKNNSNLSCKDDKEET